MRLLRLIMLAFAMYISVTILGQHLGLGSSNCNEYCAVIRNWPLSKFVSVVAVLGIGALGWTAWTEDEVLFRILSWAAVAVSAILQVIAAILQGVCPSCMGLAFLLLGLAFTNVTFRKLGYAGALIGLFGVYVNFSDDLDRMRRAEPAQLTLRSYEQGLTPYDRLYVVVADPECPACRELSIKLIDLKRKDIVVLYRWWLLPSGSSRTLRAVAAIEGVSEENWQDGVRFRRAIFAAEEALSDTVIQRIADSVGVGESVRQLLDDPPGRVLAVIAEDFKLCDSAGVRDVPSIFSVGSDHKTMGNSSVAALESMLQP